MLLRLLWVFKKRCVLRVLSSMVVPFFVTSCLSDQTVTLRSGETSTVETAHVFGGILVVQGGDDAEVGKEEATAKAIFTADTSSVSPTSSEQLRIAKEYQNQPSLAQVNAADAYARNAGSSAPSTHDLNLGQGSQISVITNNRFDPTHPEFSSSASDVSYDTVTRFYLRIGNADINNIARIIPFFFSNDSDELVQVYNEGFDSNFGESYFTIPVPVLRDGTNSVAFETTSRDDFDGNAAIRTAFLNFMRGLVGGSRVTQVPLIYSTNFVNALSLVSDDSDYIGLTSFGNDIADYNHVGRVYAETSNIASYQIVADSISTAFQNEKGDSLSDFTGIDLASDADMGLLALINGLLDPIRSDSATELNANTHGIAPLAYLHVFSSFRAGQFTGGDLIYRARGIDVARDRDDDGNLIADDTRNIVLVHNTIADNTLNQAVTQTRINDARGCWRVARLMIPTKAFMMGLKSVLPIRQNRIFMSLRQRMGGQMMWACWHPSPPPKKAVTACLPIIRLSWWQQGQVAEHLVAMSSKHSVSLLQVRTPISIKNRAVATVLMMTRMCWLLVR